MIWMLLACGSSPGEPGNPVKLHVVGVEAAQAEALGNALSAKTGLSVRTSVSDKPVDAVRAIGDNEVDVAFVTTMGYLLAQEAFEARAVLGVERSGARDYRGSVIGAPGITSVDDLAGKRIGYVNVHSLSGYILPAVLLRDKGVVPAEIVPLGSHSAVRSAVAEGSVDGGFTYAKGPNLATTEPIPNEPVIIRKRFDSHVAAKVTVGLESLAGTPELRAIHDATTLRPTTDGTYDGVREALLRLGHSVDELVPGGGILKVEKRRKPDEPVPPLGG